MRDDVCYKAAFECLGIDAHLTTKMSPSPWSNTSSGGHRLSEHASTTADGDCSSTSYICGLICQSCPFLIGLKACHVRVCQIAISASLGVWHWTHGCFTVTNGGRQQAHLLQELQIGHAACEITLRMHVMLKSADPAICERLVHHLSLRILQRSEV
jgi:hypothetical protein